MSIPSREEARAFAHLVYLQDGRSEYLHSLFVDDELAMYSNALNNWTDIDEEIFLDWMKEQDYTFEDWCADNCDLMDEYELCEEEND